MSGGAPNVISRQAFQVPDPAKSSRGAAAGPPTRSSAVLHRTELCHS